MAYRIAAIPITLVNYCKRFQMVFFVQLYSIWQEFNWRVIACSRCDSRDSCIFWLHPYIHDAY